MITRILKLETYKKHSIAYVEIEYITANELTSTQKHVCAYTHVLDNEDISDTLKYSLSNETYRNTTANACIVGIDTAHYYNERMSHSEKLADAERQIKSLIDDIIRHNEMKL